MSAAQKILGTVLLLSGLVAGIPAANAQSFTTAASDSPFTNIGLEIGFQPPGYDKLSVQGQTSVLSTAGAFNIANLTFDVGYNATTPAFHPYASNLGQVFTIGYSDSLGDQGTLTLPYDININYSDTLTIYSGTINLANAGYTLTTQALTFGPQGNGQTTQGLVATITPVPEPESYAMLLAGLGLMGAVAKRRKKV